MKITQFLIFILINYGLALAQSPTFTYDYDIAGNRIIRKIGPFTNKSK